MISDPRWRSPLSPHQYHWRQTAISHRLCVITHVTCRLFSMAALHKWQHFSFFSDRGNNLPALSCSRKFPPKFSGAQLWHPVSIWEIIHEINKSTKKSDRNVDEYNKYIHYLLIKHNRFIQTQINKQTNFIFPILATGHCFVLYFKPKILTALANAFFFSSYKVLTALLTFCFISPLVDW